MRKSEIDVLLVTQNENLAYFSGFRRTEIGGPLCLLILPLHEEPRLVLPRFDLNDAEETSWVEDLQPYGGLGSSLGFEHLRLPIDAVEHVASILRKLKVDKKTIGMELGNSMRVNASQLEVDSLRGKLREGKIVDASDLIWQVRRVKSPAEIACIRKACDIAAVAMEEGLKAVKPGVTERELQRITYMKMLELGAEDTPLNLFMHVYGGPEGYAAGDPRPTHRKLNRGDLVIFDGGANERGYFSDFTRLACIGEPTEKQRKMYYNGLKANNAAIAELRDGQKILTIYNAATETLRETGYERWQMSHVGHSIGLEIHEPPWFGPAHGEEKVESNMVVSIEVWLYDEPLLRGGASEAQTGIEDNVLVTRTGPEVLTKLERELWIA